MTCKIFKLTICVFFLISCVVLSADQNAVKPSHLNKTEREKIISSARHINVSGERIVAISRNFLAAPYVADTLIGGPQKLEQLVIDPAGFDCFTLLDVVEALRRASDVNDFPEQLKQVRYRDGKVSYESRRHFFSDWVVGDSAMVGDVTSRVAQGKTQVADKQLNLRSDGTYWLPEIPVRRRNITYIPAVKIDTNVLSGLQAGDYVGIYSADEGLDVSHTGIIVKDKGSIMMRHASSRVDAGRVVDVNLLEYLRDKPGLVVYRVK